MSAQIKTFLVSFLFILMASCGGGGGSSSDVAGEGSGSQQGGSSNGSGSDNGSSSGGGSGSGSGAGSGSSGGAGAGSDAPPSSGGGSSGSSGGDAPPAPGDSSGGGSSGSPPASGGSSGGSDGSTPPPAEDPVAFAASVVQAPADGATIRGPIRLRVEGSGIRNVELLPAEGYAPLIVRGVVTGDGIGAYIDLDTTVLEDGELTVRIAAFNARPGEGGSEITAMPPRTWIVENSPLEEAPTDVEGGDVPALETP